eukprot:m.48530 g.48530  ORF g.48530 m.48530 type:complete len:874 (+) comp33886_c0_seq1:30-2651(+)
MDRNEKVAAAKRKLKKFQQRSKSATPAKQSYLNETPPHEERITLSDQVQPSPKSPRVSLSKELFREIRSEASEILAETSYRSSPAVSFRVSRSSELDHSQQLALALKAQTTLVENLNQQLQKQAGELTAQYQENARLKSEFHRHHSNDIGLEKLKIELLAVKDQLKGHEQTVDILVEEKSELQNKLSSQSLTIQEKTTECQELMRRLQSSNQRTRQLEMAVEDAHSQLLQQKQYYELNVQTSSSLQSSVQKLKDQNEELNHQVSELANKLQAQGHNFVSLENQLKETRSKLSLSETLVRQLSAGGHDTGEREKAHQEMEAQNRQLFAQLTQASQSLQSLSAEREEMKRKFKEVADQYEGRTQVLTNQVSSLTNEKGLLLGHLQQQTAAVQDLQQKLDEALRTQPAAPNRNEQAIEQLMSEKQDLMAKLAELAEENGTLQSVKDDMSAKIQECEVSLKRLNEDAVDRSKLLSDMQNDKATISRALIQNKELKSQLEELQEAFVKMSNDKMQLATDLQTSRHEATQLTLQLNESQELPESFNETVEFQQLQQQVDELQTDNANLTELVEKQTETLQADRQDVHKDDQVKEELYTAQETIRQLAEENIALQNILEQFRRMPKSEEAFDKDAIDSAGTVEVTRQKSMIDSLSASVRQLEMERNSLFQQLVKLREQNEVMQQQQQQQANGSVQESSMNVQQLQMSFDQLQQQFVRVMREKAELSDEVQKMEHIIMQLEGETETIGEYIALYHHQRDQLREKFEQKDNYISSLSARLSQSQANFVKLESMLRQLQLQNRDNGADVSVSGSNAEDDGYMIDPKMEEILRFVRGMSSSPQLAARQPSASQYYYEYSTPSGATGRTFFYPFSGNSGQEVLVL